MEKCNKTLIIEGAKDEETEFLMLENQNIINELLTCLPYEHPNIIKQLVKNYEKLTSKYINYAYLLGYTRAIYESKDKESY